MSEVAHSLAANTSHIPQTIKPTAHTIYHTIENKTVRRIAIAVKAGHAAQHPGQVLILPPLGRRRLTIEKLDLYDWEAWEHRGLIQIEEHAHQPRKASRHHLVFWLSIALCVCLLSTLTIWLLREGITPAWFGAGLLTILLSLIAMFALITVLQGWAAVWRRLTESIGWLVVILVGTAFPATFMAQELMGSTAEPQKLILFVAMILFTSMAATLPAALYFLFKREHIRTLRRKFLLEIMRLCPVVQTTDDVEELYGPSLDDAQGCDQAGQSPISTYIPIWISTLLFSFGWSFLLLLATDTIQTDKHISKLVPTILDPSMMALGFGFLGSYFFAINFIFRRYVRADLGPKAYSHLAMRMIVTVVLVWVVMQIQPLTSQQAVLFILAFLIGILPETAIAVMQDFLHSQRWIGAIIPSLQEELPLTRLDGITLYDRARLLEEGIDNIENLATHNLVELMLQTRIPTARLVDLVDQAILHLHVQEHEISTSPEKGSALRCLQAYGIRTASDLELTHKKAVGCRLDTAAFEKLLGTANGQAVQRLPVILDALADDEWMPQIRHWHDTSFLREGPFMLKEFANPAVPPAVDDCSA